MQQVQCLKAILKAWPVETVGNFIMDSTKPTNLCGNRSVTYMYKLPVEMPLFGIRHFQKYITGGSWALENYYRCRSQRLSV